MVCHVHWDKMKEQEMFYDGELISVKDRLDRFFFLSFGGRLRKPTLVRVERTSCGNEILSFQFSDMDISSSTALHFSVELKKCRAILEVAFSFICQIPLNSAVFRISWEDYFCSRSYILKLIK